MPSTLIETMTEVLGPNRQEEGIFPTSVKGLTLMQLRQETPPAHLFYNPRLCIAVQGAKHALVGKRSFDYSERQALVVGLAVPVSSRVREASRERPFLGITIDLDIATMLELMDQIGDLPSQSSASDGVSVIDIQGPIEDCILRILRLLEKPHALKLLYPATLHELTYWLLMHADCGSLRHFLCREGPGKGIAKSVAILRSRFDETIRMPALADAAGMSPATFQQQFRKLTSMSPLQYQKQLRLLEARRLMLEESTNAQTAAHQVGYESASQFSREYSRQFGRPPKQDVLLFDVSGTSGRDAHLPSLQRHRAIQAR